MIRWTINFLTVIFLLLGQTSNGQTDTLKISPGQGVDNIIVEKSSQTDIKNFRKVKFTKDKGTGIACGAFGSRRFRATKFQNDNLGLTFEFKTSLARWPFQIFLRKRLEKITITKTATTANYLVIGKSTREDVINIYGLQPDWKNQSYISYTDKGIAFTFGNNGTISSIEIFAPFDNKSNF
jgi:hypothetical protein